MGLDDGLVYLFCDGGENWDNIIFGDFLEWFMVNSIDFDFFNFGVVFIVGICYKLGDYQFYLYYVMDYGNNWWFIVDGIVEEYFIWVVWVDLDWEGLFYVGIESGMYFFFDNGGLWVFFQFNLFIVFIMDFVVKE